MSGIAGIVNLDGAPVDRELLERMAAFLEYRGPDRVDVWAQGSAGMVHTLFHTTEESKGERQPMSLDGEVWITADARIDGRQSLVAELRGQGRDCTRNATDPELILQAYTVWGEACVDHLIGDFAFAIWDSRARRLICVRDQMGVRPFFYTQIGEILLFSNDMDCPRLHSGVPDDLYEQWLADYLILGCGQEMDRTVLEAVRRLAPAHKLVAAGGGVHVQRYWSLPVDPPTVYKRSRDYVERFRELFCQAVDDRLRTNRVAVLMSGGLDSSSVAAMAKQVLLEKGKPFEISAHTGVYEHLIPCQEGHYAKLASRALGIPLHLRPLDDRRLLDCWNRPEIRSTEPEKMAVFSHTLADLLGKPLPGRVVLTGQGGDPLLASLRLRHCKQLFRQGRLGQLATDVTRYLFAGGRRHRLYLRMHWAFFTGKVPKERPYPDWLNPELERRLDLRSRYEQRRVEVEQSKVPAGAVRPEAYAGYQSSVWPSIFEEYDTPHIGGLLEARHPFFDLRLVRYCLSLPALPLCSDKELLRRAMRGILPDEVRLRRKTTVAANHRLAHFHKDPKPWLENLDPVEEMSQYVNWGRVDERLRDPGQWDFDIDVRPVFLNYWLKWESWFADNIRKEVSRVQTH